MRSSWILFCLFCAVAVARGSASQPALTVGAPATYSLSSDQPLSVALDVEAGEFVQLSFEGRGTLHRVSIADREGRVLGGGERQGGVRAPIVWASAIAASTTLTITVTSLESGPTTGLYAIALAVRRPAVASDAARTAAVRLVERAEQLDRQGASQSANAQSAYQDAAARWREGGDARGEATALLEVGRLQGDLGRAQDAEQTLTKAIAGCRALADSGCEGTGLHRLGRQYAVTGQPRQGSDTLLQALDIRRRLGDTAGEAETLMELGGLEATRSQNALADDYLTQAVARARTAGDRRTEADAINMRAVMVANLGELERAGQLYESALAIRQTIRDLAGEAQTTTNLGVLMRSLGDSREAIARYDQALVLRRRVGAMMSIANTVHNLGVAHADLGEHELALDLFGEGLDLFRKSAARRGEAFALQAIGQSYSKTGNGDKALEYYALAAPVWKIVGDKRGEAQTLLAAAALRTARREYAVALEHYATALDLARGAGYKREVGMSLLGRAAVERAQGQFDRALTVAQEAHTLLAEIGERRESGRALAEIGATHFAANRLAEADTATRSAVAVFGEVEDRAEEAGMRSLLARVSEKRGEIGDARQQTLTSLELVESARANITSEGLSLSHFASKRALYDEAIGLFMRLHAADPTTGDDVQAFAISERMRARGLLDLLASGEIRAWEHDTTVIAELRRVQELINAKAARLTRLLGAAGGKTTPAIASARRELDNLLARLDRVRADARRQSADLGEWSRPDPLTLAEVQSHLDPQTVLVELVVGTARTVGWAIASGSHQTFEAPGRSEIARLVSATHKALGDVGDQSADPSAATGNPRTAAATDFSAATEAVSRALLSPVVRMLRDRTRVLIVADGLLQSLPFAALPVPGRPAERLDSAHEVVYLPSASVREALKTRAAARAARSGKIAVFADPVFASDDLRLAAGARRTVPSDDSRLPRLRFSTVEADTIARVAPGRTTVWSGFSANRSTALKLPLAEYGVIHLATHAVIDEERPQLSGVMLSLVDRDGHAQNGLVRMHEVYNLSLNARLVVLSACRTALGRHVESEGLIGLARGFLHAGADAVLATLWDVDDRATAAFMSRFYEGLITRRRSPAAALRAAQQAQRLDPKWADPRDWAGFVLIGYSEH